MSSKLFECVELIHNDEDCVILKVKENKRLELFKTGCLNGNETMFRLTKSDDVLTYAISYVNGNVFTFSENMLVAENVLQTKKLIYNTVVFDFGIPVRGDKIKMRNFNYIQSIKDDIEKEHCFVLDGWNENQMSVYKDGIRMDFMKFNEFMEYVRSKYGNVKKIEKGRAASTNCLHYVVSVN